MSEHVKKTFVVGNSSWWKARKYRRETAAELLRLRANGFRLIGVERIAPQPRNTRVKARYIFRAPAAKRRAGTADTQ